MVFLVLAREAKNGLDFYFCSLNKMERLFPTIVKYSISPCRENQKTCKIITLLFLVLVINERKRSLFIIRL